MARDNEVRLEERPEDVKALAVVTKAQEKRMAQQREDPVEICGENPEEKDIAGIQEVIPDTKVGDSFEGQRSGEEISVDKDCPLGIEFLFDGQLFGKLGKPRARLAQARKWRHNQPWTGPDDSTATTQFKKDQEQQAMTETRLKEPESNRMDMSHRTITLATMTAERKQHALELETISNTMFCHLVIV